MHNPQLSVSKRYFNDKGMTLHDPVVMGMEARMAAALVEKWGMVSCEADGYDEAGRQKMRLLTPEETVTRAMETAIEFFHQASRLGMLVKTPNLEEFLDDK